MRPIINNYVNNKNVKIYPSCTFINPQTKTNEYDINRTNSIYVPKSIKKQDHKSMCPNYYHLGTYNNSYRYYPLYN